MEPKVRDTALEDACSYMILARQLERRDIPYYMSITAKLSDIEVAQVLAGSRLIYTHYLETELSMN